MIITELDCRSIYPKLLYLWYGSSSQRSFAFTPGSTARLYEKHEVVLKQANLQWIPSGTCMDVILVMFKLEKSAGLRLIKTMVAFWFLNGWSSGWASERVRDKVNKWVSCFLWFQLQYGCNDSRKSCVSGRWQAWVSSFKLIEPSFKVTDAVFDLDNSSKNLLNSAKTNWKNYDWKVGILSYSPSKREKDCLWSNFLWHLWCKWCLQRKLISISFLNQ